MAKPAMASTTPAVILSVNSLPSPSSMADRTSRPMILTCKGGRAGGSKRQLKTPRVQHPVAQWRPASWLAGLAWLGALSYSTETPAVQCASCSQLGTNHVVQHTGAHLAKDCCGHGTRLLDHEAVNLQFINRAAGGQPSRGHCITMLPPSRHAQPSDRTASTEGHPVAAQGGGSARVEHAGGQSVPHASFSKPRLPPAPSLTML